MNMGEYVHQRYSIAGIMPRISYTKRNFVDLCGQPTLWAGLPSIANDMLNKYRLFSCRCHSCICPYSHSTNKILYVSVWRLVDRTASTAVLVWLLVCIRIWRRSTNVILHFAFGVSTVVILISGIRAEKAHENSIGFGKVFRSLWFLRVCFF